MSIQTVKFLLKSVHLCKFDSQCPDALAYKLHLQFNKKIEQKGTAYTAVIYGMYACMVKFIIGYNAW